MSCAKSWAWRESQRAFTAGKSPRYCEDGRVKEVAEYCETDIVNTYRVWLRYELFRGRLTTAQHKLCEDSLQEFITVRQATKPHLLYLYTRPMQSLVDVAVAG